MMTPEAALVVVRTATLAAAALLWATNALIWLNGPHETRKLARAFHRPLALGASGLLLAALAGVPVLAALAGEGWSDAASPAQWATLAQQTLSGQAAAIRLVLAAILFISAQASLAETPGRGCANAVLAGGIIATFALTGHAVLHEGALRVAHQANHAVHVLAGCFWVGALPPLAWAVRHVRNPDAGSGTRLLTNFAAFGTAAVTLVALTGAINTALILGHIPNDTASPYQVLLAGKVALVGLMLVLATVNRFWLVPQAAASARAHRALQCSIAIELLAGTLVVALVAVFGMMEPV